MVCPDCGNNLSEGINSCMCGWRFKPREREQAKYSCRKCGHTKYLHKAGPEHELYYLCSEHWRDLQENLEEARQERIAIQNENN